MSSGWRVGVGSQELLVRFPFCQIVQNHRDHDASPLATGLAVAHIGIDTDTLLPVHGSLLQWMGTIPRFRYREWLPCRVRQWVPRHAGR